MIELLVCMRGIEAIANAFASEEIEGGGWVSRLDPLQYLYDFWVPLGILPTAWFTVRESKMTIAHDVSRHM